MSVTSPPGPPPPLLCRWSCGCLGLEPGEHGWGVVVEPCDRSGPGPAEWRSCLHGVEKQLTRKQSDAAWARIEAEGQQARYRLAAADTLIQGLDRLRAKP